MTYVHRLSSTYCFTIERFEHMLFTKVSFFFCFVELVEHKPATLHCIHTIEGDNVLATFLAYQDFDYKKKDPSDRIYDSVVHISWCCEYVSCACFY